MTTTTVAVATAELRRVILVAVSSDGWIEAVVGLVDGVVPICAFVSLDLSICADAP